MLMVCPDEGKKLFLAILFGYAGRNAGDLTLHAFQNNYTPDDDSQTFNFTESTFTGYSSISVPPASWNMPDISTHVAFIDQGTTPFWECTGGSPQDMYGWYLTDNATGITVLAQRFDAVRNMIPGALEILEPFRVKLKSFA